MKKLLTVLLAIIAISITSQTVQATETDQDKKATEAVIADEEQVGIPRDWTTVIQVVDHGTPGSKRQWAPVYRLIIKNTGSP